MLNANLCFNGIQLSSSQKAKRQPQKAHLLLWTCRIYELEVSLVTEFYTPMFRGGIVKLGVARRLTCTEGNMSKTRGERAD